MVTVSRRDIFPLLVPILAPTAFSMLAPNPIQSGKNPSFLLATAAPTERLAPPLTWLDNLEHRLTTYFTQQQSWPSSRDESCRMRSSALSTTDRKPNR